MRLAVHGESILQRADAVFRRSDRSCSARFSSLNTQPYLQRSAGLRFSRYLSWQFLHAVVITSEASIILS
jgi:hypothetical protein